MTASDKERVDGKLEEGGQRVGETDDSETKSKDWDVETETEDLTKGVQDKDEW